MLEERERYAELAAQFGNRVAFRCRYRVLGFLRECQLVPDAIAAAHFGRLALGQTEVVDMEQEFERTSIVDHLRLYVTRR